MVHTCARGRIGIETHRRVEALVVLVFVFSFWCLPRVCSPFGIPAQQVKAPASSNPATRGHMCSIRRLTNKKTKTKYVDGLRWVPAQTGSRHRVQRTKARMWREIENEVSCCARDSRLVRVPYFCSTVASSSSIMDFPRSSNTSIAEPRRYSDADKHVSRWQVSLS